VLKNNKSINSGILNISSILLYGEKLTIPGYQRPYKWAAKNVNQLIDDILFFKEKRCYRLGTIVVHRHDTLDIVDGQQRLLTLSLLAAELLNTKSGRSIMKISPHSLTLAKTLISDPTSIKNLKKNHELIKSRVQEFTIEDINFFFNRCEVVYLELKDISEAFQFFDSQNSRGKDLYPHDLLKAFHLREMDNIGEELVAEKVELVEGWEQVSDQLSNLFSNYLYKVRQWCKGASAIDFSKENIGTFKGINLKDINSKFNYMIPYNIIENSVNGIDINQQFPFQLDQFIINGGRFFQYIHHYAMITQNIEKLYQPKFQDCEMYKTLSDGNQSACKIVEILNSYHGRGRLGDLYVRNLFDCALLYYYDRFGDYRISDVTVKFFLWAFTLRLEKKAVQQAAVDNFASDSRSLFRLIREAIHPLEIINHPINPAQYVGDKDAVKHIEPIILFFKNHKSIKINE
jgi:hypothetical protein